MPWVTATIQNIFNVVLRGQAASPAFPANTFLGLLTTAPTNSDGGGFVELTTGQMTGYTRLPTVLSAPTGTGTAGRTTSNTTAITFTNSGGTGATAVAGGIFSAATGGILLAYGSLATNLIIGTGSLVSIPAGQLTINDPG